MTDTSTAGATAVRTPGGERRFTAWPLWFTAAGILGFFATVITDLRPPAEQAAYAPGGSGSYTVTPADMETLDYLTGRIGYTAGFACVVVLFVVQALWRARAERAVPGSAAAKLLSGGVIAAAAGLTYGYGWKGALVNYLGPEAGLFDEQGHFVYYMLTDFGGYIPWLGVMVGAGGFVWLAFRDRLVSRILGVFSALMVVAAAGGALVMGVPGVPGIVAGFWLTVTGIWLAVGRSRIVRVEAAG